MVQTTSSPEYYAVVMSAGSKDPSVPLKIQCPVRVPVSATVANGVVSAVASIQQASYSVPGLVVGFKSSTTYGIAKRSTTYGLSIFQGPVIQSGKKFIIRRIRMNLAKAIAANMTITPKVFLDDFSSESSTGLRTINSANYSKSEQFVEFKPDINGKRNFVLELRISGTALSPVMLPIEVDVEITTD